MWFTVGTRRVLCNTDTIPSALKVWLFLVNCNSARVFPKLQAMFVIPRNGQEDLRIRQRKNFLNDVTEYCWIVYSKAMRAVGRQLIGRQGDLWIPERLSRAGINVQDKNHLWHLWTKGNIQVMDKWSRSSTTAERFTRGGKVLYTCYRDQSLTASATLTKYGDMMLKKEQMGQASVNDLLNHNP